MGPKKMTENTLIEKSRKAALKVIIKACCVIALLLSGSTSYAQFLMQGGVIGILSSTRTINVAQEYVASNNNDLDTSYSSHSYSTDAPGLFLYPKFGVVRFNNMNISVGTPISLGVVGNSPSGGAGYLIDLNFAVDINGGNFSLKRDEERVAAFGYYVGIGFGLTNTKVVSSELNVDEVVTKSSENLHFVGKDDYIESAFTAKNVGPIIQVGIGRFKFLAERGIFRNGGLRFAYRPSFGGDKLAYYMVALTF